MRQRDNASNKKIGNKKVKGNKKRGRDNNNNEIDNSKRDIIDYIRKLERSKRKIVKCKKE